MHTRRNGRLIAGAAGLALMFAAPGASAADWGIGAKVGTLGVGVDVARSFTPFFNARIGVNAYDRSFDFDTDDFEYDGDLELESGHLMLDFHPWTGGFRISAGLVRNRNQFVATGTSTTNSSVQIDTEVDFDKNAPYVGIGWGNVTSGISPISWSIDLGVMDQGSPRVDVSSSSLSESQVQAEEDEIEDELSDYDTYPVVSAGLIFRF